MLEFGDESRCAVCERATRKMVATHPTYKKDFLPRDTLYVTNTRAEVLAPRSRLTRQFWWWLLHQFWHNFECQNNSATTHAIIFYLPGQPIVKIYCKLGFDPISYLVLYRIVLDTIKSFFYGANDISSKLCTAIHSWYLRILNFEVET